MGLQTLLLFGFISISVINICMATPIYDASGNPRMWPLPWNDGAGATDFLAKAQDIAAAKMNKGFEMKKEGIKIAQESMMNKFAMLGADESKKAATTQPSTTPDLSSFTVRSYYYFPRYSSYSSEDSSSLSD